MKRMVTAIAKCKQCSHPDVKLFLRSIQKNPENLTETKSKFLNALEAVIYLKAKYPGLIAGLYLSSKSEFYIKFQAMKEVLADFVTNSVPIGALHGDCEKLFGQSTDTILVLQKLSFIGCTIPTQYYLSPVEHINLVYLACNNIRAEATNINITAEILCFVTYASNGITDYGVGSLKDFKTFWCGMFAEIKRSKNGTSIVLDSAFDYSPLLFGEKQDANTLFNSKYHTGWWKRVDDSSYRTQTFREKVDSKFVCPRVMIENIKSESKASGDFQPYTMSTKKLLIRADILLLHCT